MRSIQTRRIEMLVDTAQRNAEVDGRKRTVRGWWVGTSWHYVMCVEGSEFERAILAQRQS